jgi:hypothetical protein
MNKKTVSLGVFIFLVAILGAGWAGYASAKGASSGSSSTSATGTVQKVKDVRSVALASLIKADDIGAELLRRKGDKEFNNDLLTGIYSMQDLIDLGKRKDEVHDTIRRDDVDDKVKLRLSQLAIVGFPYLLGSKEDWSNAYHTIYAVNRKYNVAMLEGITEEYTIVIQKYAPLAFEDAFSGWNLTSAEADVARKQFESAEKAFPPAQKR